MRHGRSSTFSYILSRTAKPAARKVIRRVPAETFPAVALPAARSIRATLLFDADHHDVLVARSLRETRTSVWIATANLKSTLVEAPIGTRARARGQFVSLFSTLSDLAGRGIDVRLLHASPPSGPLREEIRRVGRGGVALRRCPRVHLKMIAIDGRLLYLGSANVTGAGIGAKGAGRRNFEIGIVTDDDTMLDRAQERFDRIWRGVECKGCKLRQRCDAPLDQLAARITGPARAR